jgi:hypothetical protein
MARTHRTRRGPIHDLEPYDGCDDASLIGLRPLAVGWLRRDTPFDTGTTPPAALEALRAHCDPALWVCRTAPRRCPLCNEAALITIDDREVNLGGGELRIIGHDDIFAAPALIYHYVTVHNYRPPREFVDALLKGAPAGSPEHRALIKTLG